MKNEMWLIWKQPETRRKYKIGVLIYNGQEYSFHYVKPELDNAKNVGFHYFPGFEDIDKTYCEKELFANIETRLPNTARADYLEILNSNNLEKDSTKGRLVTDNYEFVPAFDSNKVEFDVAGTKHCPDVEKCKNYLHMNDKLLLELESENRYDEFAIKVIFEKENHKYHLGYVPRYYSEQLTELLKNNISYSAMIQSIDFENSISDENIVAFVKLIFNN